MKYYIKQMILGPTIAQAIEQEQFDRLKNSRDVLLSARAIEEKYDILISNYFEFENELLTKVAEQMIFNQKSYDDFYDIRSTLNRRVINLLTSTKLYSDQIEKHVRECLSITKKSDSLTKKLFSSEYDSNIEYRFLEAMRNHVQHYGLAIHSITLPSTKNNESGEIKIVNTIKLFTHKDDLIKDSQFHKKTLRELDDKVNLINAIRVYINSFNIIHSKIRSIIDSDVIIARNEIHQSIENYRNINSGDALGIYAYSVASDDPLSNPNLKFPIMLDWDDVRVRLIRKNQAHHTIYKHYISGNCL